MDLQRPRILAIDDTPANLLVLATALSSRFTFQLASNGADGLLLAAANPPDLVLLDVMMPGMNGYEVCRHMKADPLLHLIPVIFVTALTDAGSEMSGLELGASDYITKPINVDIAFQRINNMLERESLRHQCEIQRDELERVVVERTRALQAANAQLQADKSAANAASQAKSIFLANVSHELRTPLNAVLGMATLIQRNPTHASTPDKADKILTAGRSLLGMVESLLEISSKEGDATLEAAMPFDVRALLQDLATAYAAHAARKGLRLMVEAAADVPASLSGRSRRMREILEPLIDNAIKFSASGVITLRAEMAATTDAGARLGLLVRDQGVGISADKLPQVFEAFAMADDTSTRSRGGAGLGLTLARRLAERAGGELGADSTPGQGSCFRLTLPVSLPGKSPGTPAGANDAAPAAGTVALSGLSASQTRQLQRLQVLLQEGNTHSLSEWRAMKTWLMPLLAENAQSLDKAIEHYAFNEAASILGPVLQRQQLDSPSK